ncbi:MAG: anthranilate phosphoribosyltransferase [Acidobacteria bacterium]|nr:anthranilate phosphoribosyltransferase [Acidobacteriota bacterium]MDA1234375.1 anthranilate phosphoribosyltransferase [Acidobacteriota bacterium]
MSAVLEALHKVVWGENLTELEAAAALEQILSGETDAAVIAGLLTALRMKGETVDEIVGFARAMRAHAAPIVCHRTKPAEMVDTCGTGGDGADTFNISTVSAFVVAGAGVPVAKHGNRSISSRCGSADVLEAAGAVIQLTPEQAAAALDETGIGFLFAPLIHPAMRHVQPIRKELKMRTIFNLLGPLTNPAGAGAQVVGVFSEDLVRPMAEALARLGVGHAFVVHGQDGLDEITTTAPTKAAEVLDGSITEKTVTAEADFGLPAARPEDLAGGDRQECALILQRILEGQSGPQRDIVLANAAAALVAAGKAKDFRAGVALSSESIDSGAANDRLKRFVEFTSQYRAE